VVTLTGFLGLALLPVAATAVSPEAPAAQMPVAIVQPIAAVSAPLMPAPAAPRLSETGLLVMVGTGLLLLGAVVRKATQVQ
jgi:hypothetical protein